MPRSRFELNSEQTLRLEELRHVLVQTLPAEVVETVEFPITHYAGCGAVCMPGCTGNCVSSCASQCRGGCTGDCAGTCKDSCAGSCRGCRGWY